MPGRLQRTARDQQANWRHALVTHRAWDCSAATIGRQLAEYGYASGRQATGKQDRRPQRLHRPRWAVLGWHHGQLRRIVAGWWCQAQATDARLIPGSLVVGGAFELAGRQFTHCRGCEQAIANPGRQRSV
jgi:hypothetical protein